MFSPEYLEEDSHARRLHEGSCKSIPSSFTEKSSYINLKLCDRYVTTFSDNNHDCDIAEFNLNGYWNIMLLNPIYIKYETL